MSSSPMQFLFVAAVVGGVSVLMAKHFQKTQPPSNVAVAASKKAKAAPMQAAVVNFAPTTHMGYGEQRIAADSGGQYHADVQVNGAPLRMMVDTGATYVSLSYQDATRIGIYPSPADYKYSVSTANGTGKVALVSLTDVRIGSILLEKVEALVSEPNALSTSLLGMSFLKRLSKMEVASGALVLKQ